MGSARNTADCSRYIEAFNDMFVAKYATDTSNEYLAMNDLHEMVCHYVKLTNPDRVLMSLEPVFDPSCEMTEEDFIKQTSELYGISEDEAKRILNNRGLIVYVK